MEALIKGAETVFTTKTVVGEATKVDDTIIIPLVDVSFGIGAGASCASNGSAGAKNGGNSGGAGGMKRKNVPQRSAAYKRTGILVWYISKIRTA